VAGDELIEGIWERDATVWTGADEAQWLGWLDEPLHVQ
jgi:transaldolase / glucose-6-phosphate isomerase